MRRIQSFSVSVIIPVFNASQFVAKAVESALIQPEVVEVILIEDGSKDNSLFICKQLENRYTNVNLYTHLGNENRGAAASRNVGINMSQSEFIAFLDADDYYLPDRFAIDEELFKDSTIDGVYGCVKAEFDNSDLKKKFLSRYGSEYTTTTENIKPDELLYKLLFGGSGRFHTNAITLRKAIFEKFPMFNTELRMAQDSELWVRLAANFKLIGGSITLPIAVRRVHSSNRIHADKREILKYSKMMYSILFHWAMLQKHLSFGKKNYFFVAYRNFVKNGEPPLSVLCRLVTKNPKLLFNSFLYRKLYQILLK